MFDLINLISTLSLLMIAIILLYQFQTSGKLERKKNTYEQLYKTTESRKLLTYVVNQTKGREFDHEVLNEESDEFRKNVYEALNYCEFIAIGIHQGILDEEMVKEMFGSLFIVVHSHFDKFILERRMKTNNPETFRYFSQLAKRWGNSNEPRI